MKGVGAGFVLVCLVGVVWCGGPEWSPCVSDGQSPRVVPKEVELSPPRVVAGKEVVLTVKGENIGGYWNSLVLKFCKNPKCCL